MRSKLVSLARSLTALVSKHGDLRDGPNKYASARPFVPSPVHDVISAEFDRDYYLRRYPDINREGIDPVIHYIHHGAAEGRDPSPNFNTKYYYERYSDVSRDSNAFYHYIKIGRAEGRITSAKFDHDYHLLRQWELSAREQLLLTAALNPNASVAAASWREWAQIPFEQASPAELRLLPATYAHLYRIAPTLDLPKKLRGNVHATFCRTVLLAEESLPIIHELSRYCPVMLTKGFAMCLRFNLWASRPMWDVDIHVPFDSLENACKVFAESNWTPRYGMSWDSLLHRSCLRRNSWNLIKGKIDVDLHWRLGNGPAEDWLDRLMWECGEQVEYSGRMLVIQSAEFAFISSLNHGFREGNHSEMLQTVIDCARLLPVCRSEDLFHLIEKWQMAEPFNRLIDLLKSVGLFESVANSVLSNKAKTTRVENVPTHRSYEPAVENAVVRHPLLYGVWSILGRRSGLERLLLKLTGPLSKPLKSLPAVQEYDLSECAVIDAIGGPGWSWPEPDRTCFWADRADARLLIPLKCVDDYLFVLAFADRQKASPNSRVEIFANGFYITTIDFPKIDSAMACCLMITRRMLIGPWVELSFRPTPYRQQTISSFFGRSPALNSFYARSVALRKVRLLDRERVNQIFSGHNPPQLHLRLLRGEEPYTSKLERIQAKIENSPYKGVSGIPEDFDPLFYALSYSDLFEAEVDPYQHFIEYGSCENRVWR